MDKAEWEKLRAAAYKTANDEFSEAASSIIRLTKSEISDIVSEANVDSKVLSDLISKVNESTASNREKADALRNMSGFAEVAVALIGRLI